MKRIKLAWVVGLALCGLCRASTIYVSPSGNDANNGSSWALAKQTVQAGVDASALNDTVLVTNGTYVLMEQITVSNAITIRSVNGPTATIVDGDGQVTLNRCFYLEENCALDGFTITNGFSVENGGGVYTAGSNAVIKNCVLIDNNADKNGGGTYGGILNNCTITDNAANSGGGVSGGTLINCTITGNTADEYGGGTFNSILNNCTISRNTACWGGGASLSTLNNCMLSGNSSSHGFPGGGGAYDSTLNNCTLINNSADYDGGGAARSTLNNCTISGNTAGAGGGVSGGILVNCTITGNTADGHGGGAYDSTLHNCVAFYNSGSNNIFGGRILYTCAPDAPKGSGNTTNLPIFINPGSGFGTNHVLGNYRLAAGSPCINAGHNALAPTNIPQVDLDGNLRIWNNIVDMGAYEYGSIFPSPTNISASDGAYTNKITVTWDAATGATGYRIFRHTSDDENDAEEIGTSVTAAYNDTTATTNTTYHYWIKATNAAGASAFGIPDTGYLGVIGPLITVNGMAGDNVSIRAADPVTIAVEMMNLPTGHVGHDVDWWVLAHSHTGELWFYFDSDLILTPFDGNLTNCRPAYQGPLFDMPPLTLMQNMLLAPGTYNVWFAVDYPMDGILRLDGTILLSRATIVVE